MALFTIKASAWEAIPSGNYTCEFLGLEEADINDKPVYRWNFKILEGEYKDKTFNEIADKTTPTFNNKLGKYLIALASAPLDDGVTVDPDKFIGKRYFVIRKDGRKKNGEPKVIIDTFSKL